MTRTLIIGCFVALIALVVETGFGLESSVGMNALFKLRGEREIPRQVVIVAMDEKSETELSVGGDLTAWRKYDAGLIKQLTAQGVALIVFDLQFIIPRTPEDSQLAEAMRLAGNVLLTECVQKFRHGTEDFFGREECSESHKTPAVSLEGNNAAALPEQLVAMRKIEPYPLLADAVLDHAAFHLIKDAADTPIREAWFYFDALAESPSLPVVIWAHYLRHSQQLPVNISQDKRLSEWLTDQRRACLAKPMAFASADWLSSPSQQQLRDIVCGPDSRYLDFYGPAKTFRLLSYSDVYQGKGSDLAGRIVLVGKVNRQFASGNIDTYQAPFSDSHHGKMAGVEVMATQLANLLENRSIHMPYPMGLLLLLYGVFILGLLRTWPGWPGIALSFAASVAYAVFCWWRFSVDGLWLPLATPLLIQLPLSWLISLYGSRRDLLQERKRLLAFASKVFPQWESILPGGKGLWSGQQKPMEVLAERNVIGICMATDIESYTQIATLHSAHETWRILNAYYQVLGQPVTEHGGVIADVTGDSMMAIWLDEQDIRRRLSACLAALQMADAVDHFNKTSGLDPMNTRIGLFEGDMTLGELNTGVSSHFRAIGDTVNTASRIQSVNKQLGTRVLASRAIVQGLDQLFWRPLGLFRLVGRAEAVELVELVGMCGDASDGQIAARSLFCHALQQLQEGQWQIGIAQLQAFLVDHPQDGPAQFFLYWAQTQQQAGDPAWDGVVTLDHK